MNIASSIKGLRLGNHYTQEKLANICGVSRQAVAKWESGENLPDIEKIIQLSKIFNVTTDELLTGKTEQSFENRNDKHGDSLAANEKMVNLALKKAMSYRDPNKIINQFIAIIGKQIGCSRTYIFEVNIDGSYRNTYEWCNKGITPEIEHLQSVPLEDISTWLDAFSKYGHVFIEDVDAIIDSEPIVYQWLKPQGIKSLMAYPLFGMRAFIGIDNPIVAFLGQTSELMEIMVSFVEIMLRQRDLSQELKMATMQDQQLSEFYKGVRLQINLDTGLINCNQDEIQEAGYEFKFSTIAELEGFASNHLEFRDHLMLDGVQRAIETKENLTIEFLSYKDNRQIRWNKLSLRPFINTDGKVTQLYGIMQDASDEHRIIEQYNRYISHLSGGLHICYLSKPIHLDYVSDDLCRFLGYERDEFDVLVGSKFSSIVAENDRPHFQAYITRLSETPGIKSCEYSLRKKDGSYVCVIDTMESIRDSSGVMYGYSYVLMKSQYPALLEMAEDNSRRQLEFINVQSEVMESLGKDYLNVFRVWLDEDKAQIVQLNGYVTKGMDKRSPEYIPYFRFCQQYVQDRVYSEDKKKMLRAMHPDTVRNAFNQNDEYTVVYRAVENNEVHFYQLKYVLVKNQQDSRGVSFVAGFKSVDNVIREEHSKNERLRQELNIIQTIFSAFTCGYYIDYKNSNYIELACDNKDITEIVGRSGTLKEVWERTKITFPDEEAYTQILEFLRYDTLSERLNGNKYLSSQVYIKNFGWYDLLFLVVDYDNEGNIYHAIYVTKDVTEEKEREKEYEFSLSLASSRERSALRIAYIDALTKVMNRAAFERDFSDIEKCEQIGLIFCDVNGLKTENDTYGHDKGDILLKKFANMLKKHFSVDSIYRIGGDEFMCMVDSINEHSFNARVDKLIKDIADHNEIAALGAAYGSGKNKEALLKQAEIKMYENKRKAHESQTLDA